MANPVLCSISFTSAVLNNSEFVAPLLWVDGALPKGLWRGHDIIFSCHILPKGCLSFLATHINLHNTQCGTSHRCEDDITDLQDRTDQKLFAPAHPTGLCVVRESHLTQ